MRRPRTDAQTLTLTSLSTTLQHTTGSPTVFAWLVLGTGVLGLLALLTAELVPAIQALVRFPTAAALTLDPPGAPNESEPLGFTPFTFDDIFARL